MRLQQLNYQPVSGFSTYWPEISLDYPTVHPWRILFIYIIHLCITWVSDKPSICVLHFTQPYMCILSGCYTLVFGQISPS